MQIKIDKVEKIVFLGGGQLLIRLSRWCKCRGDQLFIVTSPRHAGEIIESGKTFAEILSLENISFIVVDDISSNEVKDYLGNLSNAFCLSFGAEWIFKKETLENLFKVKLFNLHGPNYLKIVEGRIQLANLLGNRFGFCQLHLVDSGVDTGEIVKTDEFLYPPSCRVP